MEATSTLFKTGLTVFAAYFLTAAPLAAQEPLKVGQTTVGGPGTSKLCIREYGKTPAEAFAAGAKILEKADALLGADRLHGNVRIRVLPEKEKDMFVVEVYSIPDKKKSCPVNPEYLAYQLLQE
ncbi:hypothetical protein [Candidatus Electrothrix sp.]|uniref:hypothetical protein n=1 Tax=Candidatus Electrothrix sp. TaxID=2170559 RepID=UPI004055FFCD